MKTKTKKVDRVKIERSITLGENSALERTDEDSGRVVRSLEGNVCATNSKYTMWKDRTNGFELNELAQIGLALKTISEKNNIAVLHEHDRKSVIASTESGTAIVWEDTDPSKGETGIKFRVADIGDSKVAHDVWVRVRDGIITQGSIGFYIIKQEVTETETESLRVLKEIELEEVSICLFGANPKGKTEAHSLKEARSLYGFSLIDEPERNHSEAGGEGLDEARDAATSEPESERGQAGKPAPQNHSEIEARKKRDRLRARLRLLAEV